MATSERARQLLQLGEQRRKEQQATTSQAGGSGGTGSISPSKSRQQELLKLGEERRKTQGGNNANTAGSDWVNRYNRLQETLSGEYDYEAVRPTVDKLISDYRSMRKSYADTDYGESMYNGYMGLLSMQERDKDLRRWQREQEETAAARAKQASGILPEEAEAMRQEREQLQAELDAYKNSEGYKQGRQTAIQHANLAGFNSGMVVQPVADSKESELTERIADIDAQLTHYDRLDGFQDTRIKPLTGQEGFSTARADFRSGSAAQGDTDELGEYLAWWDSLNDYTREAYLENRLTANRGDDAANPWDDMIDADPNVSEELRNQDPRTARRHWERMTEDEINAYYYIANTEGLGAAKEFLEELQITLDQRNTVNRERIEQERMQENTSTLGAMALGVMTVPENLIAGPMAFLSDVYDKATGKEWNPYNHLHGMQGQASNIRSAGSEKIREDIAGGGESKFWNGVGEVAANAYQAGLSTLDSLAGMATMGGAYTVSMGMGAASSRMREMYESGATDQEIYVGAIGSGILEALFEKVSLDSMADKFIRANPEKWVKKALMQAGVEGSEEFFTEISNMMLDAVNRGVNSDHNQRVRELMNDPENPMSRADAEQQAAKEDTMDVFWAFMGGVMSGGMSSIGGAVMDSSRQNQIGQDAMSRNVQGDIIAEAQELRAGDELAASLQAKQEDGTLGKKNSDATKLGRLIEKNVADMTARDMEAVTSAVEARLEEENQSANRFKQRDRVRDARATAEALVKSLAGESLTVTDRFHLALNEKYVDQVKSEIYSVADGRTDNNRWVQKIGTYTFEPGTFGTKETHVQQAGREAMETAVKEAFGSYGERVMQMYLPGQNRTDYVAEMQQVYQAGLDGVDLKQAPKTKTLEDWQRQVAWDMGQGKSDYDYDNNQGFVTIKGEATPVNIVGVAAAGKGQLMLRTDDGSMVAANEVTFGSYSQSKLYSVIASMGVDASTANQILGMSQESKLDLNTFARAVQDAYYAGRNGIPLADIQGDRMANKLSREERKLAWQAGRAAARNLAIQKGKRVQQGKHRKAAGGLTVEVGAQQLKNLNEQQEAGMNAAKVLSAMGLDVTVYASTEEQRAKGMENGNIWLSDGSIRIDLNAGDSGEGVMAWALSHEFTHFVEELSPEKFQTFRQVLFGELGQSGQDVAALIEEKAALLKQQKAYQELSEERLMDIATSEVVAEMLEPMLTDTDAIARISDNLRQQDKGLWEKIKTWLQGLVEKLKNAYKDLTPGSAIAQQTRSIVTQSEEILNAWVDVATDAVVNYNLQDGQKNNTPGGVQFSTRNVNGENIVWIEDSGLTNKQLRDHQTVANYIAQHVGEMYTILESGMKVYLGEYLPGEYTHSRYTSYLQKKNKSILKAKNKAVDGLGEMIEIASNRRWEATRHQTSKDAKYGMYRYDSKFAFPIKDSSGKNVDVRAYDVELLIRNASDGKKYLYDIVNIKENTANVLGLRQRETRKGNASVAAQSGASMRSIHHDSQNVNQEDTLFSSRNVQQTKNLVALHNITEDKFLKTLELGGFPMPSIAITKADIPHTNFGDITVVFGRETIDPKANRKNTVYSADAWTPTVPQVEYEADSKATSRVYKRLSGLRNQVDEYFQRDLGYATYNLENALNRYGGEEGVVQSALDNYGVKAAYLEEQGKHIQPVTRQEQVFAAITPEVEDKYLKIMQVLGITSPEEIDGMILKDVRNQHGEELEKIWPGVTKTALRLSKTLKKIQGYLLGIGTEAEYKTVTDVAATKEAVDSAIDQAKFEVWVRNLYQGVEKSSGVYNGKPRFTEAGNSRTFKQLHLPATLEGIVKAMAAQNNGNTKNVSGFNGVKTLRAGTAERFSSIADMHKMEGRLQNLTEAQQNEIHDSLSSRLYDTIKAIDEESGANLGESNSLIRYDTIGEILMEIAESGSYNVADIQRVFQQYGKAISDETAMAAKELLFDVSQMPVNIFEAKPERAVGFEEIKNVLVPDTASQKLLQELDSRGIPYQTYQAGNEEQRHQMVQDMEDIRFSQRSAAQLERENEKLRRDKEYLKELVKIQRTGNKDVVPTRASVNHMAESLKKETGARGSTEELARLLDDFYRYIGKGNLDTVTMDQVVGKAADWLQEHRPVQRDPYAQEVLDWMKKRHVHLSQPQVDEIKYQYGSLREFQSAIKGSIIIDQKANTSLDQLWQEGASQFADQFDLNMSEGDMPGAFADLVERLRSSESTETAEARYYQEEIHRDLMDKVYNSYFGITPVESISDTLQQKIDTLKAEKERADKENRQLSRENEQLRKDKEYLKELIKIQRQGNKDVVPKKSSVNDMAERLKSETGATGSTKELAARLDEFYRYLGKGNENVDTSDEMCQDIVQWLKEHGGTGAPGYELIAKVWDTYYDVVPVSSVSDTLRQEIARLKDQKDAAKRRYKEELQQVTAEKKQQEEEKTATLRAMQGIRKAAVESYRKQQSASDQRMRKLYEQQYRLVMDDYQRQLETMEGSEKTQAKVEGWRKTEERGKLQRTLTTLNKMMLNPTKTAFVPDSLQPAVIKAMEAMNNYRMPDEIDMGKIRELQNELNELILDGATKNKKRIRAIHKQLNQLQGDYGSPKDNLVELKWMYAELMDANEGKVAQVYDEGVEGFIADAMEAIGDTDYSDLSLKQLQALNDAYAAILHRVRTANNTFAYGQKEAIDQLAKTVAGDFRRLPDREKLSGEQVDALEKFGWNNLKPEYAFQRLGSATMTTLYHNLRKGEDVFYQDVEDARGFALGAMARHGYQNWKDQTIEYESVDGKKFSLNLEERMSLYAYSRRRQAIEHLTKGGIVLNENTKRTVKGSLGIQTEKVFHDYNNYRLSLDTIQAIGDSLTQQQRAFAEEMQGYLSTVCADKNNEISRALYGVSKAKEKYYWPLKASSLFYERVRNQLQNPGNRQKNAGHMKATTPNANNPVEVAGFLETWGNHVNNTAMYHAFTLPMEDFLRVYNFNSTAGVTDESIVQLITKKHGKGATDYIDQFLKDLNQGVRADPRETIASSLTSKFKKGAVSASLSVAIQQPSAVGRAFAVIDFKYFSLADLRYYATSTVKQEAAEKQWEKVKKYAPVAGIKEMGRFDVNMGRSTVDFITGAGETGFLAKLDEISGYLPERMDQATWLMIWNAAERQCRAQGYKGEALNEAAGKLFTECITKTQVYDSVFSRSGNMRSKSLYMNMATSFMAEPTTTANMFMSAMADVKNKDYKAAKRKVSSIAAATVLNALLASLVYAARDDDEDKSYTEKYLKSLTSELVDSANPLGYVPIAKDLWSRLQGYDVDRSDMTLWSEAASMMKRLKSAYDAMGSLSEDDADYEVKLKEAQAKVAQAWGNAAGAICNLFGVPAKNVLREIRAVVNTWETVGEGRDADWETTKYAMWEAFQENLPEVIRTEDSKADQLYKALVSGSDVWVERMKASYTDEKAFDSAVRGVLRDYDKRIRAAAKALDDADSTQYKETVQEILEEGHFTEEQVEDAILAEAKAIKGEFEGYSTKTIEKFVDLYEDNLLTAEQFTDFWEYRREEDETGKRLHDKAALITYIGKMKVNTKAKDTLYLQVLKYSEDDLESTPWHSNGYTVWEAKAEHPALAEAGDSAAQKYVEIQSKEISAEMFAKVWMFKYEKGEDDKRVYDWKDVRDYIDALPISDYSKDELFLALGYSEKILKKIRWS